MNISKRLLIIGIISLISSFKMMAQNIPTAVKYTEVPSKIDPKMIPWPDTIENHSKSLTIIEPYVSELLAQTPPCKKATKIAQWLDKKLQSNVEWRYEFVPGNYNPETKELIALAHVISNYPEHSFKILQALRADEKAQIAALDVKHAFFKEQHPDWLRFIDAVGYSNQPGWLEDDLIGTFLVPSLKHPELKFICSKDAYEENNNKALKNSK